MSCVMRSERHPRQYSPITVPLNTVYFNKNTKMKVKSETRSPKPETNSNFRNFNVQNSLEHLNI